MSEAPSDQRTACICGILPPSGAALQPGLWAPLLTWLKGGVRVLSGERRSRAGPSFCLQSSWIRLRHSGWQVNLQSRGRESKGWGQVDIHSLHPEELETAFGFDGQSSGTERWGWGGCVRAMPDLCTKQRSVSKSFTAVHTASTRVIWCDLALSDFFSQTIWLYSGAYSTNSY